MKKYLYILVGPPCSGKSSYAHSLQYMHPATIVSLDDIRQEHYGNKYKFDKEQEVLDEYNVKLERTLNSPFHDYVVLDNTHCKEKYIDQIISKYKEKVIIKIKFFDVPLYKLHIRNVIRYLDVGKWIPIKIMNIMHKNYLKIDKKKYDKYLVYK